ASDDPAQHAADGALRERALAEIRSLSEPNRLATTLFYINGYSVGEVAEMLDAPVGTVKRRLHDSRKQLREGMVEMVRESLDHEKPEGDLKERIAADLVRREADWDRPLDLPEDFEEQWARRYHERRMKNVRANAAQYGIEPDEELPRMVEGYRDSETFRDDMKDMPCRWGFPEGIRLTNLRDLSRELSVSPLSIYRWGQDGMPELRYDPWVLYDADRVEAWTAETKAEPVLTMDEALARTPLLSVLRALADGMLTADEAFEIERRLWTVRFLGRSDPVWDDEWESLREAERRANAAQFGLDEPTRNSMGIPDERARNNWELRDICNRLSLSPIDVIRWTRNGMPCLRTSPYVRWDVDHVRDWLAEKGIMPTEAGDQDTDQTELYLCRLVADGKATPEEAHEGLSGRYGVV
ncbi:MAG TPA: sigma-70 family RNA polymerase sigma factor, partial [Armatimonadota bacterium]|nr:sigma-70 family RNA polymerase sigma factor [Armatimonadota bacterium]